MTFTDALAAALAIAFAFLFGMMYGGYRERRWWLEKERMAQRLKFYEGEIDKLVAETKNQYMTVDEVQEMMNDSH